MSIPIRINPFFWVIAALISWSFSQNVVGMLLIIPVIFFSVLFHEYGHALTAILFGQKAEIALTGFGGLTTRSGPKLSLWQEFIIVLNGPVVSFLIYLFALYVSEIFFERMNQVTINIIQLAAALNLFWTIFNLIPVQPLDGGHLLRITLEGVFGFRGIKAAAIFSLILSIAFGFFFISLGSMFIGFIFFFLAYENYMSWKSVANMSKGDQDQKLWDELREAQNAFKIGDYEKSWEILNDIKSKSTSGMIYLIVLQMMANILFIQQKYAEAYALIDPVLKKVSPDFLKIAQQIAYKAGDIDKAIELGKIAYQESPDSEVALVNALSHAAKAEIAPTIGWLKVVYEQGIPDFSMIIQRKEFDFIRNDPSFQELTKL